MYEDFLTEEENAEMRSMMVGRLRFSQKAVATTRLDSESEAHLFGILLRTVVSNKLYFGIPHPLLEEWGYKILDGGYPLWEYPQGIPLSEYPLSEYPLWNTLVGIQLWEGGRSRGC